MIAWPQHGAVFVGTFDQTRRICMSFLQDNGAGLT